MEILKIPDNSMAQEIAYVIRAGLTMEEVSKKTYYFLVEWVEKVENNMEMGD